MSPVGEREIRTQRRVADFLHGALGYARLGDWKARPGAGRDARDAVLQPSPGENERRPPSPPGLFRLVRRRKRPRLYSRRPR